jgi:hypothetical protein
MMPARSRLETMIWIEGARLTLSVQLNSNSGANQAANLILPGRCRKQEVEKKPRPPSPPPANPHYFLAVPIDIPTVSVGIAAQDPADVRVGISLDIAFDAT